MEIAAAEFSRARCALWYWILVDGVTLPEYRKAASTIDIPTRSQHQ
jgi:hypothetical protein